MNSIILSDISDIEAISDEETILDDEGRTSSLFYKISLSSRIIYSSFPIEYPKTSPDGVATIFNISGWSACFSDIQYSINGSGGSSHILDSENCVTPVMIRAKIKHYESKNLR
uniref:Uncharacterized protein n=1 Tax=Rhizophagus irregularis (strain DAOM 181602 / DAOM 197198 / MUCL 43194) TaxID=747089 RepID=U9SRE3_RHIID